MLLLLLLLLLHCAQAMGRCSRPPISLQRRRRYTCTHMITSINTPTKAHEHA